MQQSVEAGDIACRVFGPDEQHVISWAEKWKCFRALCQELPSCTFVIDGFDECKNITKTSKYCIDDGRSKFLRELIQAAAETKTRILLISRDCADVRAEVNRAEESNLNITFSFYKIIEEDTRRDIQIFSKQMVDLKLSKKMDAFRTDIAERAASKSQGMFLWIHLLSRHLDPSRNSKQLENIVTQTPAGIEQAYEQDLVKISQMEVGQREEAIAILRWVLFAFRPLRIKELAEALVLQWKPEGFVYPTDMLPDNWNRGYVDEDYINGVIRQPLGSLVELRSLSKYGDLSDQTLHLTHFSVKEYLLQRRIANILTFSDIRSENRWLGKLCLRYLCYDVFSNYKMEGKTSLEKLTLIYPFLPYAATSWYEHSSKSGVDIHRDLLAYAKRLLNPATKNWVIWSEFYEISPSNQGLSLGYKLDLTPHTIPMKLANPLYYASLLGLSDILVDLIRQGLDVNAEGGTFDTPLQAAIIHGHAETVVALLQAGASVTRRNGVWGSTLRAAAWRDNVEILRTLLSHGADPNMAMSIGMYNPSALSTASSYGHVNAVRMLVEAGADVDQAVTNYGTPLMIALYHGHINVMRVLVSKGAKLVVSDSDHARLIFEMCLCGSLSPVQEATKIKSQQIFARIVPHRPDLEANSSEFGRMIPLISSEKHGATYDRAASVARIARSLLGNGLDLSRYAWDGLIALDIAIKEADAEIGRLFLQYAALRVFGPFLEGLQVKDDSSHENAGRPFEIDLQMAIFRRCHGEVEELLTENRTFYGSSTLGSALLIAVLTESVKTTNLLLKHGVSVSYKSRTGRTALHYAALRGNLHIITSLINYGAETWCQDSAGNTPLLLAVGRGQLLTTEIVKHLAIRGGFGLLPNPSGLLIGTCKLVSIRF
jgi:ankyrin repeat protein